MPRGLGLIVQCTRRGWGWGVNDTLYCTYNAHCTVYVHGQKTNKDDLPLLVFPPSYSELIIYEDNDRELPFKQMKINTTKYIKKTQQAE